MALVTEYPLWFIPLCLLLGALYAFLLYFRTSAHDIKRWLVRSMAVLRFFAITIIAFLLLSPLVRKNVETVEKPLIIIAQDNSGSIFMTRDSAYYRNEYPGKIRALSETLSGKFDVAEYSFGDKVTVGLRTGFSDKQTDISLLFDELKNRYYNRNVGALVLATDGIYNKGTSPFYAAEKLAFPVYTLALGDTTLIKDIILRKALYNRTAYIGDKFPVEIDIDANKCSNLSTEVTITRKGENLFRKNISFPSEKAFVRVNALLDAKETGINRFTISIKTVDGEFSTVNNKLDIFVDVTDTREKVLVLSSAPHPDIAAIKSALEASSRFEVELARIADFTGPVNKYDLVILYQLPALREFNDLSRFTGSKVPLLIILGSATDYDAFNKLGTGAIVSSQKQSFIETLPVVNPDFTLFSLDKEDVRVINEFPPLQTIFGSIQFPPVSEILSFQKIGNVRSGMPQILFFTNQGKKTGIIIGENIWKWRLSDFLQKDNHAAFNDLVNKVAQYLSVKEDKSFLRVKCRNKWMENEPVEFEAELYNQSYELINDPDINLTISDENNKSYPFVFGKSDKSYYLNAGTFPPGSYRYQAATRVGNNPYQKTGQFVIEPVNLELVNTVADHNLLYRISRAHNGEMFFPSTMDQLGKRLMQREDITPVSYWQKKYSDLTGNIIVFLLILILISTEWFLRKRSGIY